jgi:hypothetical protein
MAQLKPGQNVSMRESDLRFPPAANLRLTVAVSPFALKVPTVTLTTLVGVDEADAILWVGSVDETLLTPLAGSTDGLRERLAISLLTGEATWRVIRPGELRTQPRPDTVYQGDRPWVVLAGPLPCGLLAVPLNDRGTAPLRPYQAEVAESALRFEGSKASKLELNHLWSFPTSSVCIGDVAESARAALSAATATEFRRPPPNPRD